MLAAMNESAEEAPPADISKETQVGAAACGDMALGAPPTVPRPPGTTRKLVVVVPCVGGSLQTSALSVPLLPLLSTFRGTVF